MSKPVNQPTFADPLEGQPQLPPPTYVVLADFAGVKPGSIGKSWVTANLDVTWEEALKYTQEMAADEVANEAGMKN